MATTDPPVVTVVTSQDESEPSSTVSTSSPAEEVLNAAPSEDSSRDASVKTLAEGISSIMGPVMNSFDGGVEGAVKSQSILASSIDRLTRELDKLLEDAPLPFAAQHASRLSGIRKRAASLNTSLRVIQKRITNIERLLAGYGSRRHLSDIQGLQSSPNSSSSQMKDLPDFNENMKSAVVDNVASPEMDESCNKETSEDLSCCSIDDSSSQHLSNSSAIESTSNTESVNANTSEAFDGSSASTADGLLNQAGPNSDELQSNKVFSEAPVNEHSSCSRTGDLVNQYSDELLSQNTTDVVSGKNNIAGVG